MPLNCHTHITGHHVVLGAALFFLSERDRTCISSQLFSSSYDFNGWSQDVLWVLTNKAAINIQWVLTLPTPIAFSGRWGAGPSRLVFLSVGSLMEGSTFSTTTRFSQVNKPAPRYLAARRHRYRVHHYHYTLTPRIVHTQILSGFYAFGNRPSFTIAPNTSFLVSRRPDQGCADAIISQLELLMGFPQPARAIHSTYPTSDFSNIRTSCLRVLGRSLSVCCWVWWHRV